MHCYGSVPARSFCSRRPLPCCSRAWPSRLAARFRMDCTHFQLRSRCGFSSPRPLPMPCSFPSVRRRPRRLAWCLVFSRCCCSGSTCWRWWVPDLISCPTSPTSSSSGPECYRFSRVVGCSSMCRLPRLARAWPLVLLLCAPFVGVRAQDTRMYAQRVDTLYRDWQRIHVQRLAYEDSVARARRAYDTVVVGSIRILTTPDKVASARQSAQKVLAALSPQYGQALATLHEHWFVIRDELDTIDVGGTGRMTRRFALVAELWPDGRESPTLTVDREQALLETALTDVSLQAISRGAGRSFANWIGSRLPSDTAPTMAWSWARLDLLSSQMTAAHRCYSGNVRDCELTLASRSATDPATELFDAADRRHFFAHPSDVGSLDRDHRIDECVAGNDSLCIAVLRDVPEDRLPDPVPSKNRFAFVQLAVSLGGPGSMERLLLTNGTPAQRIEAAARMPVDSVLRLWVQHTREARMGSRDMSPADAGTALLWILACG